MTTSIIRLEDELWNSCVVQLAAPDVSTAELWEENPLEYQLRGYRIRPMPDSLKALTEIAVADWERIESEFCARAQISTGEFLEAFEKARMSFQAGGSDLRDFSRFGAVANGTVMNMNIVNLFAWVLPSAVQDSKHDYVQIGCMVTAVFYTEVMFKASDEAKPNDEIFRKLDARWAVLHSRSDKTQPAIK